MKKFRAYKIVWLLFLNIFLCTTCFVSAQERGMFSFATPRARFIEQRPQLKTHEILPDSEKSPSHFNQKFVGAVGGISFQNVAIPDSTLRVKSLTINYNIDNQDGKRIELFINGQQVNFLLYDWEAIPTAKFANSDYTSCFTYFGKLENQQLEKTILENGGHILNYHPAFSNTLLGWRLADMDLLILYNFTTDLPKLNGKYILGAGENKPSLQNNQQGAYRFHNHIRTIENTYGYRFQSYVITDYPRITEFNIQDDSLIISGYPHYYCWQYRYQEPDFDVNAVADSISDYYMDLINREKEKDTFFDVQGLLIDSLISVSAEYEKDFSMYKAGTMTELLTKKTEAEKRKFLRRYTPESIASLLIQVQAEMISHTPVYLKAFSSEMSAFPDLMRNYNPAVWNATVNTMRFSALFRYIITNFPDQWKDFYDQIVGIEISPKVTTPTVIYETGNLKIQNALKQN